MSEALQQLVLDTLDASGEISDTRSLTIPGQTGLATSHDAQITILGALNSLLSREVCHPYVLLTEILLETLDDQIHDT